MEITRLTEAEAFLLQHSVVLFDLDDTLYSEKDYVRSGYAEIAKSYPQVENMAQKLWSAFENGEKAIDYVLQKEGIYTPETAANCLHIYRYQQPDITLNADALDLLNTLQANGVRLGLITDGRPEGQWAKIQALGIEPYFEKIIVTDELGGIQFRKPSTTAFERMQMHFQVPYDQMVYVGDNPKKDFVAPRQLGMDWVYFKNPNGLYSR